MDIETPVQNRYTYDFIIAGAGAAGLSLASKMVDHPRFSNKKILIADKSLQPVRNKTWCLWQEQSRPVSDFVSKTWTNLEVRFNHTSVRESLKAYRYLCIKNDDFSQKILSKLTEKSTVTLLEDDISGFETDGACGIMKTSHGLYKAPFIFQSTHKPSGFDRLKMDLSLKQHFMGWHIRANKALFNPEIATFMDFDVPQKSGVSFMYVLPFSEYEALVEYTVFSEDVLSEKAYLLELGDYMKKKWSCNEESFDVLYTEKGVIPMEDRRYPKTFCERVWNIGAIGGAAKPSTGYTFSRIQKQTDHILQLLLEGKEPDFPEVSSYRYRAYDMLLLYQLKHYPKRGLTVFDELFKNNSMDSILRFLDEKTSFAQDLKIMYSVPWRPFFQSIWKMKHRLITGA